MQIAFLVFPIIVLATAFFYLGRRLISSGMADGRLQRLAWRGLLVFFVSVFASVIVSRLHEDWSAPLSWFAYTLLGLLSYVFTFILIRDLIWLVGWGIGRIRRRTGEEVDTTRRRQLLQMTNLGILGVAGGLTGFGIYEARRRPGIVEIQVEVARLPPAFQGFRIVQITDLHAGLTIGREWIESVVEEVTALRPDLIAFTGDLVDGSVSFLRDAVEPMGRLQAPHGKFFVTGNHEYYSGAEEWVEEVRRLGYDVLMNEHRIVERGGASIVMAGVTDFTGGQFFPHHESDPRKALAGAPADTTRILLAHQPKTIRKTDDLGIDLVLSGHTHGGQFFPWNLVATLDQPYLAGLHDHNGTQIYVSKGTGYWGPPVRLAARSEITLITLVAKV